MNAVAGEARMAGPIAEIGAGRIAAFAAMIVFAIAVQSTVLPQLTLLGVIPQVALVVVVSLAYLDGERVGVVTGFAAGLLQDFLLPGSILGLTALVYTVLAYTVAFLRQYVGEESVWSPVIAVAAASAAAEASYAALAIIFGQEWVNLEYTLRAIGLVVLYNTLLTPFIFPLVRRIAARLRPEKVYR